MLQIEVRRLKGLPGPARALELECRLKWHPQAALFRELELTLGLAEVGLSEPISATGYPRIVLPGTEMHDTFRFPLSLEAVRYIETHRNGSDVPLRLTARGWWTLLPDFQPTMAFPASAFVGAGASTENGHASWDTVPQSEWLKRLAELQWDEIELFELSKLPLEADASLTEALERLRSAREALRRSDFKAVLINCRSALESAAKHQVQGTVNTGFALLFDRAFPKDARKQQHWNTIVTALTAYTHEFGRHEQAPAVHPSRSEAEYVFTSTLGFFSMISRRITGGEL